MHRRRKLDAYELMNSQKIREYNLKGAQKTDEYVIIVAPNPCVQTKKVKNPCVKNSSCVAVRKKVKPVVRDPMGDDRVLSQEQK